MPFYAVKAGKNPGVYLTWSECQNEVKGFPKARYKKFETEEEAWDFVQENASPNKTSRSAPSLASAGSVGTQRNPTSVIVSEPIPVHTVAQPQRKSMGIVPPTTLFALKGTISEMKLLMRRMSTLVEQAERQMEELKSGCKRSSEEEPAVAEKRHKSTVRQGARGEQSTTTSDGAVIVYTDGCCHNNGRARPKAGIGVYWGPNHHMNTAEPLDGRPTNNRAEIQAAIKAIRQAKVMGIKKLNVHTDSEFLINSNPVKNKQDFEELDGELTGISVTWTHVAGHVGIPGNEAADKLANEGARKSLHSYEDEWDA